LVRKPLGK